MNKDKSPIAGDGGSDAGGSTAGSPLRASGFAAFGHDISRMPHSPPRSHGHRRAQSEILGLPDDLDLDLGAAFAGPLDGPSLSDENDDELFSMFLDVEKFNSACGDGSEGEASSALDPSVALSGPSGSEERPRPRHQHSQSMDGSSSIKPELLTPGMEGMSPAEAKKAISAAKLAELALVDPKRAKRIWANRQSAARSKERKMRYIAELERKVQALQTESTTLTAQLALLQRDTTGLTAENSELKLRLQNMEQQVHLQDALNDALKAEVQRLKIATGQIPNGSGGMMNFGGSGSSHSFGSNQQFFHHNQSMQSMLAAHQLQQLQIHPQHQQPPPPHHHQQLHPLQAQQQVKLKGPLAQNQRGQGKSDTSSGI